MYIIGFKKNINGQLVCENVLTFICTDMEGFVQLRKGKPENQFVFLDSRINHPNSVLFKMSCLSNFLLRKYGPVPNSRCNNWINSYRTDSVEVGGNLCEFGSDQS